MELTLDEALQKAIEAHKADKIQEAERFYTAILQAQPKHPDANHNVEGMGVIGACLRVNKEIDESILHLDKAISFNPDYPEALDQVLMP